MTQYLGRWQFGGWTASCLVWVAMAFVSEGALAQSDVVPDDTLGSESSLVVPGADGLPIDIIEGGAKRGENLFHSFQEFNISAGQGVYFANPAGIATILSRVTGQNSSDILGTLGVLGEADLLLMNPNGIIFGENAQLNVGGSFVATTANAIAFPSGGVFSQNSAVEPQSPLLTVDPSALLFNQIVSQPTYSIAVRGNLSVDEAQRLLLVGGNAFPDATATGKVLIDGGTLRAPGGRIELGGLAAPGMVGLSIEGTTPGLNLPLDAQRADITFDNAALADVSASDSGDIAIYAQDLSIQQLSEVRAGIAAPSADNGSAGDIKIDAIGKIDIAGATSSTQRSGIVNSVESGSVGQGGDIGITTGSLSVTSGAQLNTSIRGVGDAGNVVIDAQDDVTFEGGQGVGSAFASSRAYSRVERDAVGQGGDIRITAGSLSVNRGAILSASARGEGDSGNVTVNARDQVVLNGRGPDGFGGIYSQVLSSAVGNGGNVEITVTEGSLFVTNGGEINTSTSGQGNAGDIVIGTRDAVRFEGGRVQGDTFASSRALSQARNSDEVGQAGDIRIATGTLSVAEGAFLSASTFRQGNPGNVIINARDQVVLSGTEPDGFEAIGGIYSQVLSEAIGDEGKIEITVAEGSLLVTNGAQVITRTQGQGNAGSILIETRDRVTFDNDADILSNVDTSARGDGGNITVTTRDLFVTNGARMETLTRGEGNAGNVFVNASDEVSIAGISLGRQPASAVRSGVTGANARGAGGGIQIVTGSLNISEGGRLESGTQGRGDAGDLIIRARNNVTVAGASANREAISAAISRVDTGARGEGGNIDITAGSLSVSEGARLNAETSGIGNAGNVLVNVRDRATFDNNATAFSRVSKDAEGNGGDIEITVTDGSLSVLNGSRLETRVRPGGNGDAGNISIQTRDTVTFAGASQQRGASGAFSQVERTGTGEGGNITITVTDGLLLIADGARAATLTRGEGNAGDLAITADQLTLQNRGQLLASGQGDFSAGNLTTTADNILLDSRSSIEANTESGDFGNITLNVQDSLLLRRNSRIRTNATGTATGGNIAIEASEGFVLSVPEENSDITANAFAGRGGTVEITAQGIFGYVPRSSAELRRLLGDDPSQLDPAKLPTNDITAISQTSPALSGQVTVDTLAAEPNLEAVELPVILAGTEVAQGCQIDADQPQSTFVVTGRGGVPPLPEEALDSRDIEVGLVTLDLEGDEQNAGSDRAQRTAPSTAKEPLVVEAQGWIRDERGSLQLVANASEVTSQQPWSRSANCQAARAGESAPTIAQPN